MLLNLGTLPREPPCFYSLCLLLWLPAARYVAYLEDYAAEFQLLPLVRFHTCVQHIRKPPPLPRLMKGGKHAPSSSSSSPASSSSTSKATNRSSAPSIHHHHPEGGPYVAEFTDALTQQRLPDETFDAVAVCSGLHNAPRVPTFPNMAAFRGTVLHSAAYRGPFKTMLPNPPLGGAQPMVTTDVPATSASMTSSSSSCADSAASSSASSSPPSSVRSAVVDVPQPCDANSPNDSNRGIEARQLQPPAKDSPSIFAGKRVLILGSGETAFDIGYAAAVHGASAITMTTRHGFVR